MTDFIIWVPLVAAVAAGLWFLTRRQRSAQVDPEFLSNLDAFATQVQESSLHLTSKTDRGDDALQKLLAHVDQVPAETAEDINNLQIMWEEMASQIGEFNNQPTQTTLQSSILTTRIHKHKEALLGLITKIIQRHS